MVSKLADFESKSFHSFDVLGIELPKVVEFVSPSGFGQLGDLRKNLHFHGRELSVQERCDCRDSFLGELAKVFKPQLQKPLRSHFFANGTSAPIGFHPEAQRRAGDIPVSCGPRQVKNVSPFHHLLLVFAECHVDAMANEMNVLQVGEIRVDLIQEDVAIWFLPPPKKGGLFGAPVTPNQFRATDKGPESTSPALVVVAKKGHGDTRRRD